MQPVSSLAGGRAEPVCVAAPTRNTAMTTPQHLSDRYELGEILGFGGMSEVHLARDVRLHRDVAVKVLRADLARDPSFYLRFRREAQNAAALNHPSIVAVYDTGEAETPAGPLPYIVMEYVEGVTLRDIVHTDGPLPPRRAIEIIADACVALNFSHENGIIHRDVKPANIMITSTNAVKVMDFGIARAIADSSSVTQTAAVPSTPGPTSIRWAACSTKCSPVNHLSPETRPSRWPTSMSAKTRFPRRSDTKASRPTSTPSCSRRWPRTQRTATRRRRRCAPTWSGCTTARHRRHPRCSAGPT